jgi:predicted GIY-YIG superfamily endonuclease
LNESYSKYWVYVLENPAGKFYIGSTGDLAGRVIKHNNLDRDRSRYTAKHGPWQLVF